MTFNELALHDKLLRAIESKGYSSPTPIQEVAIPVVLEGRDVLGGAQTGTGKTAAFALPILQKLSHHIGRGKRGPRALILTPTRELASQVNESFDEYGRFFKKIYNTAIFGGVKINPQIKILNKGIDILVATPGRLLDHHQQGSIDLSEVDVLVLDEADRMLDMGFLPDIKRILKALPKKRQNLLFSATYSMEIKKLAKTLLVDPVYVEVNQENSAADTIKQILHFVPKARKAELLAHLITTENWYQGLIFTRTKHGANNLTKKLKNAGVLAEAIHGNKSQGARTRALDNFKKAKIQALVATDIAARGLDINDLEHVVNFELPHVPEDYVHRIGRTGRAGSKGIARSLVSNDEKKLLVAIQKLLDKKIQIVEIPGYTNKSGTPTAASSDGNQSDKKNTKKKNAKKKFKKRGLGDKSKKSPFKRGQKRGRGRGKTSD